MSSEQFRCPRCRSTFRATLPVPEESASCPVCRAPIFSGGGLPDEDEPKLVADQAARASKSAVPADDEATIADAGALPAGGLPQRAGSTLALDDFRIQRKLGSGGMGAVYLAHQPSQDRPVALKLLSETLARQHAFVARFYREAKVLACLEHPNIVRFFGAGQERNVPFLAMEYIEGYSASLLLRQLGRFRIGDALHIILKCADALRYAHERNIVHRDIKPENIMITRLGHVKITDMGLAKSVQEDLGLTDTGAAIGSPKYMAPEQARNAKQADSRSDLYALGGVLYHFLTGQVPFVGVTGMELMLAKEQGSYPSARQLNPEVPRRLDLVLDKMLAKSPRYRYPSCEPLIRDLGSLNLAHEHLSFNPLRVVQAQADPSELDRAEILLIQDKIEDIFLIQQTLEDGMVASNVNVVHDGNEALAYLRRDGRFASAPTPSLILLGCDIHAPGGLEVLQEIKSHGELGSIPVIVFATAPDSVSFLEANGFQAGLVVGKPDDCDQFDALAPSADRMCLTVVE